MDTLRKGIQLLFSILNSGLEMSTPEGKQFFNDYI